MLLAFLGRLPGLEIEGWLLPAGPMRATPAYHIHHAGRGMRLAVLWVLVTLHVEARSLRA